MALLRTAQIDRRTDVTAAELVDERLGKLKRVLEHAESRLAAFKPHLHNIKPKGNPGVAKQFEPGERASCDESLLGRVDCAGGGAVSQAAPGLYLDKHQRSSRFFSAYQIHFAAPLPTEIPVKNLVPETPQMAGRQILPENTESDFLGGRLGARG